jgi:diguanylate cyclase (GGDEF)-like protein
MEEHLRLAVARARAEERELAFLHVGLDHFRLINDSLGREAGDATLKEIADRLEDLTGPRNVVARPGGDQFCVLLPDVSRDAGKLAEMVATQIEAVLHHPFAVQGADFELSASIGVSIFPADARDETTLLAHAEAAMHDAKQAGAGTLAVYSGGTQDAYERLVLPLRLRTALEHDDFVLHYQPIFDLGTRDVASAEALLRYRDPKGSLVPPGEFLAAAEFTGLIEPIGDWVVAAACEQMLRWRDDGITLGVNVNLSLRQVRQTAFASRFTRQVEQYGIDPGDLVLEITESTAMLDPSCVEVVMKELREAGFRLAIDDFGTGYSSLARLRQMPVDIVKLDRTLLVNVEDDQSARNLASAALNLIAALDMTAVAEGVETATQLDFLTEAGCTLAQGFHLARPLPPQELARVGALLPPRG